jgi:hypothetical protein
MLENSSLAGMKAQRDEDGRRVLRGGHAAADQRQVCWEFGFPLDTLIYIYVISSGWREIFLALHLLDRKYC